jgi:hypothetical protein
MLNVQSKFSNDERANLVNAPSLVPAQASNLFNFLAMRLSASFTNLNCANFGLRNTVTLTTTNGIVTNTAVLVKTQTPTNPNGGAAAAQRRHPAAPPWPYWPRSRGVLTLSGVITKIIRPCGPIGIW